MNQSDNQFMPLSVRPKLDNLEPYSTAIIIPMKDGLEFFKLCFHSVLNFTDRPYKLIVINNLSRFRKTRNYLWMIQKNHPIQVLNYDDDYNYSAEVNLGLRHAFRDPNIKYGLILNADTVVSPGWLSGLINTLTLSPRYGIVGPSMYISIPEQEKLRDNNIVTLPRLSGACMAFKREVWDRLDGFDEDFIGGGYEDWDFCERARKIGFDSVFNPSIFITHYWKKYREGIEFNRAMNENRLRFSRKHPHIDISIPIKEIKT